MSVLKWIREKYQHRRAGKEDHDPWWVTLMLDVGRPLVAVLILVMCAPGEHYLAMQAGWSETLAWGMPGTLTAYAGIAAVVATKRPKGAPGRKTAISGAVVSIALAMAAQPIAHLYGKVGLNPEAVWLTVVAGLIPAAVFGHLLHMGAAAPKPKPVIEQPQTESKGIMQVIKPKTPPLDEGPDIIDRLADMSRGVPVAQWLADNRAEADKLGMSVSELMSAPDSPPDMATWTGHADTDRTQHVSGTDSPGTAGQDTPDTDNGQDTSPAEDLQELSAVRPVRPTNVRSIKKPTLSADVRAYLDGHPDADDSDLAAAMSIKWPEAPWDSVRKARARYQEKQEKTS